jgi:hypothetical protein
MAASNSVEAPRGGYRGTSATARFTQQLVWLDTPETKRRITTLATRHRRAQAVILRAVSKNGLAALEQGLADGTIDPDTLV